MAETIFRVPSYVYGRDTANVFAEHRDRCLPVILQGTTFIPPLYVMPSVSVEVSITCKRDNLSHNRAGAWHVNTPRILSMGASIQREPPLLWILIQLAQALPFFSNARAAFGRGDKTGVGDGALKRA